MRALFILALVLVLILILVAVLVLVHAFVVLVVHDDILQFSILSALP